MKRAWRIANAVQAEVVFPRKFSANPRGRSPFIFTLHNLPNCGFARDCNTQADPPSSSYSFSDIICLFSENLSAQNTRNRENLRWKVRHLRDELVESSYNASRIAAILDWNAHKLSRVSSGGSALVELLNELSSWPDLGLEVFHWRRKRVDFGTPMTPEEYSKGITFAGRLKNADLAVELFTEAINKQLKTTSTYNALMAAFMVNGMADRCQSLFLDLKRDSSCRPSIVTYNILISLFGRSMLVDHMEATLQEIKNLNLFPNVSTYNHLIAGYITAWMWDRMERTFARMKKGPVKPDIETHLLMLRGYAHAGNLEKMEEMYELVREHVHRREFPLIRAMICAYCKSSVSHRVTRIGDLMRLIPEEEYRPWLNVLLIRVYAKEDLLDEMESSINEAFEHNTAVITRHVMNSIIATYFRCNAVDRLSNFIKRAESAGWRICRSLYHCKMVMYASQKRLEEMESVLSEMENFKVDRTKKTHWILYKAYSISGQKYKVEKVVGLMCKQGYEAPENILDVA